MNKDKIVVVSLLVLLLLGIGEYYFYINKTNSTSSGNGSSSISTSTSQIENTDWGTYDSNDITLTKSIEITNEGVYTLTGTISDGLIYIKTDGKVKLILNGVSITNSKGPAIYVENADTLEIETVKGTTNTLVDGKTYSGFEDGVEGVIYSKDDLVLSGEGTLKVTSNLGDGIVSKDDLKITGGNIIVSTVDRKRFS